MDHSIVRVDYRAGAWSFVEDRPRTDQGSNRVQVSITLSTHAAIKIPNSGFLYLVVGQNAQTNVKALALSEQHASTISTPESWHRELLSTGIASLGDAALLHTATYAILALSLLNQTVPGTALFVHETNKALQRAIKI
ncbi:uncharacterized protein EURHEDRAFT_374814 [Aspergillus ruber CBS 135680]|uniref:Uncharacterized protein n=1 Tax=Aspergillus ruber (strain CBS 135680) TaxID=1388766 RepID=A0A017SNH1_ASPRC|nr:uncharacterized protein EURHEDRAFT_374814 [Aspergillus ruber CBS 135680]EYE97825.1 hypothetical protein EURHEDRAFT_374814 [Aspergillus ruber CBS 135680]